MDSHTSPGPDNITSIMLINTSNSISIPLSIIFNSSLTTGSIPLDWKVSYITPIPKTSPPSSSPNNYRPISLLSLIGKTMERHIFHLISDHLESNNTISDAQFGFRPRYSTESALLSVTNSWFSTLYLNNSVCAIFLDLKKAFDSVPHKPLLNVLLILIYHRT